MDTGETVDLIAATNSLATGGTAVLSATANVDFVALADFAAGSQLTTTAGAGGTFTTNTRHVIFTVSDYNETASGQLSLSSNAEDLLLNIVDVIAIPEPSSFALMLIGAAGFVGVLRLRRR
jgi:hypothetical protein